ncbi:hypothetical protein BO71DRAFT_146309 [Aspergillus ellipticus CBS 707.79]|uniref:Uncharacterized protein n=1 Tax=Aspergillus ellipticus CBS 707.79 TaxID=1448320 RepID=A0A319DI56_9EURO|nr:hypothetical protein BO71DRAFT_146309 [Aspergillus ellipticus CBS 707.79]
MFVLYDRQNPQYMYKERQTPRTSSGNHSPRRPQLLQRHLPPLRNRRHNNHRQIRGQVRMQRQDARPQAALRQKRRYHLPATLRHDLVIPMPISRGPALISLRSAHPRHEIDTPLPLNRVPLRQPRQTPALHLHPPHPAFVPRATPVHPDLVPRRPVVEEVRDGMAFAQQAQFGVAPVQRHVEAHFVEYGRRVGGWGDADVAPAAVDLVEEEGLAVGDHGCCVRVRFMVMVMVMLAGCAGHAGFCPAREIERWLVGLFQDAGLGQVGFFSVESLGLTNLRSLHRHTTLPYTQFITVYVCTVPSRKNHSS